MEMKIIHSGDDQIVAEILTGNVVKLFGKLCEDTGCPSILTDNISVFETGQMTGICTEAYSASECKCGWLFCHMSYLLLAVGTCPQAKKIPNINA
jgi:hypothetical protein